MLGSHIQLAEKSYLKPGNFIMNNSFPIKNIENIIYKYFHNTYKLYSLEEKEIEGYKGLYDIDIIYLFNDRAWTEIWKGHSFFDINYIIDVSWPFVIGPTQYFNEKNGNQIPSSHMVIENFIFYFTGLLYLGTIEEINEDIDSNLTSSRTSYLITKFLDPKDPYVSYIMYDPPVKDFFPSLIERYSTEQLFLLSMLFIELQKYIELSSLGIKYWIWIYENTDDDIREKIMKEFEEKS